MEDSMSIWTEYTKRIMEICGVDEMTAKEVLYTMEHTAFDFSQCTDREFAQEAKFIFQEIATV